MGRTTINKPRITTRRKAAVLNGGNVNVKITRTTRTTRATRNTRPNVDAMIAGLYGAMVFRTNMRPQQEELKVLLEKCGYWFSKLSLREWFKTVPVQALYGAKDDDFADQTSRAEVLVNAIIKNPKLSTVQLFDGHGRFLYAFLYVYYQAKDEKRIPKNHSVKFVFYDFEKSVDNWHKAFFPSDSVECYYGNVFRYMDKLMDKNSIIYLNFCGLGPNTDDIHTRFDKSLNWLSNVSQTTKALLLINPELVSMEDLSAESGTDSMDMRSSLQNVLKKKRKNKRENVCKLVHELLKSLPKEHFPNQINLLDMLSRFMASTHSFELMVSFDVSGIIRNAGRFKKSPLEYCNITYTVWHVLDELLGTLKTSRKKFVTYLVPESSRLQFRSKTYEEIFENLVGFQDFGNPNAQYEQDEFSVSSDSELDIDTSDVVEQIMEGRKRHFAQSCEKKQYCVSGKYGTRSKSDQKESEKEFFKRAKI